MIDSFLMYMGEVFLDTVINKSQNPKFSKKTRCVYSILFVIIALFYISLFSLLLYISIINWKTDIQMSIRMLIVCIILIIAFLVYGYQIFQSRKKKGAE